MSLKKPKENSLSDKLSSLIQAKPTNYDSDNEDDFISADKLLSSLDDKDHSADELDIGKYSKTNYNLLDEDDAKYLGKGVSRKELKDFLSDDGSIENYSSDSDHDSSERKATDDEIDESEEEEEDDEENEEERHNKKNHKKAEFEDKLHDNIKILSSDGKDVEKGKAIKNQLHLWDFFLDCRMKFQICLVASNQYPNYQSIDKFRRNSQFNELEALTNKSLKHLLRSFMSLQEILLNSNDEYVNSIQNQHQKNVIKSEEEDSEIASNLESEDEMLSENQCFQLKNSNKNNKNHFKKLSDFSNEISKRHKDFEGYRNSIIQKWDDKTRIGYVSSKNFSAFKQSTIKQIEQILKDKQRLITRTQTKRSRYHILGQAIEDEPEIKKQAVADDNDNSNNLLIKKNKSIIIKEIYDDDDFYHQLLSELVKRKASDITDPVQLGRQWMQLQQIRSKMKKTVDTKASKGRKVRFVVHPKLVNFMMPTQNSILNEESRVELINSLFGKIN